MRKHPLIGRQDYVNGLIVDIAIDRNDCQVAFLNSSNGISVLTNPFLNLTPEPTNEWGTAADFLEEHSMYEAAALLRLNSPQ